MSLLKSKMFQHCCSWRLQLRFLTRVALTVSLVSVAAMVMSGCDGRDSDDDTGTTSNNTTGPLISDVSWADIDGNGVDGGDIVTITFDQVVRLTSSSSGSFEFPLTGETFGSGATVEQTVPGSETIQVVLGASAVFSPGSSRVDIDSVGLITIEDHAGDTARPSTVLDFTIDNDTATAPTLISVNYNDVDGDGTVNEGDTLLCNFDKPVTIPGGETVAGNFTLPVTADSFGAAPTLSEMSASAANTGVLITLGTSPVLTVTGSYSAASLTAGSPSGIAMAAAPGITDTTGGAVAVTGLTEVDLGSQATNLFHLKQEGSLFLGTIDSATPDVSAKGYYSPQGAYHIDGSVTIGGTTFPSVDYLFVADTDNNRVVVYDGRPTGSNASAFAVLGQTGLSTNLPNRSEGADPDPTASTLWSPTDVHFDSDSNRLFVCDSGNNRVLVFNDVLNATTGDYDLADGAAADIVIGQTNFTSNDANQGAALPDSRSLSAPLGIFVADGQLAIADSENHRVMIWSSLPTSSNEAASVVLGQASFSVGDSNGGGAASASTMDTPSDVFHDLDLDINGNPTAGAFIVADSGNNRVLAFMTAAPATGDAADGVLGQADFVSTTANQGGAAAAATLDSPRGVYALDNQLWVADRDNNRVVYYDTTVLTDGEAGAGFLGQANGASAASNRGAAPAANTLSFPSSLNISESGTQHLFICDTNNHRLLDFVTVPIADTTADLEQGQPGFTTSQANGHRYNQPADCIATAGQLIVADRLNNRIAIYTTTPTSGDPTPDVFVGQDNEYDTLANQGGTSPAADTLDAPEGVATDGTRLIVADTGNNRVLVYNSIPVADGTAANIVLGQSAMTDSTPNAGGLSGATMDSPTAVLIHGGKLFVCDRDNHRVLIWNDVTTLTDGKVADVVVGQVDLTSGLANRGSLTSSGTLDSPNGLVIVSTTLFVADTGNNRVLAYGPIPTAHGATADYVIGQETLSDNGVGGSVDGFDGPTGLATDGSSLFVADSGSHRIAVFESIPTTSDPNMDVVLGQTSFLSSDANQGLSTPLSKSLFTPRGMFFDGHNLYVSDMQNSRVVRYR